MKTSLADKEDIVAAFKKASLDILAANAGLPKPVVIINNYLIGHNGIGLILYIKYVDGEGQKMVHTVYL